MTHKNVVIEFPSLAISREEAYQASLKYFNGDTLATDVFLNKYALKDSKGNLFESTPEDMHRRMAKEFARIESKFPNPLSEEFIFYLFENFKYIIPQGSPMAGIGNNLQTLSIGNCFVIGNSFDSYGGILQTDQELVHLMKRRGGVGIDLSHIRPKGFPVNNAAIVSTGVVPFMERYSNTTREVAQDGRRGALMITLKIEHPDVEDFINAKLELKKVTGANISVKISDEFMYAVMTGKVFRQQFPVDSTDPVMTREIDPIHIWKKLVHNAWKSAEPGIFFWDKVLSESPADCYSEDGFKTVTTNPCVTGDTFIALADGRTGITIKQLSEEGDDIPVYCLDHNNDLVIRTMRNPRITGYNQPIYKVTIEGGHSLRVTGNHKFLLKNGRSYKEAKDLTFGDSLSILEDDGSLNKLITTITDNDNFYDSDPHINLIFNKAIKNGYNTRIENSEVLVEKTCEFCKEKFWINFNIREVSFCSTLCSNLYPSISSSSSPVSKLRSNEVIFVELDGVEDVYNGTVDEFHNFFSGEFLEKTKKGNDKFVYINQENCGELPLSIGDSCRLMCLNLYSYVLDPFTPKVSFNFSLFQEHSRIGQRLMDDMIELEKEKIDKIIQKIKLDPEDDNIKQVELDLWTKIENTLLKGHRTGLGITAEGDMIAALGLRYGTPEATAFSEKVHSCLATNAFIASVQLAKERGPFPIWNYEKEKNNPFLNRIIEKLTEEDDQEKDVVYDYKNVGRRNIAMLTVAPTGSISVLTQTSSGMEPVFSLYYTRRRKINPNDKSATSHFVDEIGDHWEEYAIVHHKFQTWATINGHGELAHLSKKKLEELIQLSPYYKATANDIDWKEKVKMQGLIQRWNDHAISITQNLPEHVSEEVVDNLLIEAWQQGCKGVTVYRDKSRSGVLISSEENKINVFKENHAPKRPKVLPCDIMRFVNKGEKWVGFLGLLDNKPYEVFTGPADIVPIPLHVSSAEIVKERNGDSEHVYNLKWIDKDGFHQEFHGLSRAFNREFWNIGRLISGLLRHGMPLLNVILLMDKLEMEGGEQITHWKSGVKRMFKKYIAEGTRMKGEVCPECNSSEMIYKEGCVQCNQCGYSKCS